MRRSTLIWMTALFLPALAWADPQLRPQGETESLKDYLNEVAPLEPPATDEQEEEATGSTTDATMKEAMSEQAASPAGTAAAPGFADRVGNTLQNFLPLFQGLVDAVNTSDDEKTVTVRFNPIRAATFGELGLTAAAIEPEPFAALLERLPDDSRAGDKEAIQKGLDDFTNLAYTATYNYVRRVETEHLTDPTPRRWFFGRNPRLYEEVFARMVGDTLRDIPPQNKVLDPFRDLFPQQDIESLKRKELVAKLGPEGYQNLVDAMIVARRPLANFAAKAKKRAELFGKLTANQPQANLTITYHDRDPLVGRNETSVNLSVEMPAAPNINELLRSWRRQSNDWGKTLADLAKRKKEIEAGTKWSVMASYKDAGSYKLSYQPVTEGAAPVGLDLPGSHELSIKAQYSRNATWQTLNVGGQETFPAFHFSAEIIEVSGDPTRNDRQVFTLTYDVPTRKGMSFPVSLVYANRSEFLGEPDHQFGAHFGLNLNSLFGDQ